MNQPTPSTNEETNFEVVEPKVKPTKIEIPEWKQNHFAQRGEGIFNLSAGWISNPLHSGRARNYPCPCQSGKKIKKCCGRDSIIRDPRFNYTTEERHKLKDSSFHEKASSEVSV